MHVEGTLFIILMAMPWRDWKVAFLLIDGTLSIIVMAMTMKGLKSCFSADWCLFIYNCDGNAHEGTPKLFSWSLIIVVVSSFKSWYYSDKILSFLSFLNFGALLHLPLGLFTGGSDTNPIKPPFLVWMQKLSHKNFENKGNTKRITHGLIYEFNLSKRD